MQKPRSIVRLSGEIKTPPFSDDARREAGFLLRKLQDGEKVSMPDSRSMVGIGRGCHELRVDDGDQTWRILYCLMPDAIVVLGIFSKKTEKTPKSQIDAAKARLKAYRRDSQGRK